MSGHSKWANIKRRKEAVDGKKAKIFSKLGREIMVAVKSGGPDLASNNKLRDIIQKAKSNNMPNDNINRCILKAAGDINTANYEEFSYEGFGPFQTAIIVDVMTDNKNRAAADIRLIFDRMGGNLGQTGSVGYMFEKKGEIILEKTSNMDIDSLMLELIDQGALDVIDEEEYLEVFTKVEDFQKILSYIEGSKLNVMEAEVKMVASIKKELSEEEEEKFQNFLEKLEDNDDVQNVWHNVDI